MKGKSRKFLQVELQQGMETLTHLVALAGRITVRFGDTDSP